MRTLQTLSESHQSQLSRLATQLHQQQREAEALRQQLGTMQQHGSSAVASVAASLL